MHEYTSDHSSDILSIQSIYHVLRSMPKRDAIWENIRVFSFVLTPMGVPKFNTYI